MILECRKVHEETGISENDIAKRLMDYGYHAPTLSFPVHGTLMIEPTESESLAELDNFVHVMLTIWDEIQEVKNGEVDKTDNVLVNAPHPEYEVGAQLSPPKGSLPDRKRARKQVLGERGTRRQHVGRP